MNRILSRHGRATAVEMSTLTSVLYGGCRRFLWAARPRALCFITPNTVATQLSETGGTAMRPILRLVVIVCSIYLWQFCGNPTARLADITNWQTGQEIPGTEEITPGPYMELVDWNTDSHNLRYADFSGGLDLHGSHFTRDSLDFSLLTQANVTGARFQLLHADRRQRPGTRGGSAKPGLERDPFLG